MSNTYDQNWMLICRVSAFIWLIYAIFIVDEIFIDHELSSNWPFLFNNLSQCNFILGLLIWFACHNLNSIHCQIEITDVRVIMIVSILCSKSSCMFDIVKDIGRGEVASNWWVPAIIDLLAAEEFLFWEFYHIVLVNGRDWCMNSAIWSNCWRNNWTRDSKVSPVKSPVNFQNICFNYLKENYCNCLNIERHI